MTNKQNLPAPATPSRALTTAEFHQLADVPPEMEWFANQDSHNTRRGYKKDLEQFMTFVGIRRPEEFRIVTRAHILAWRADLEGQGLAGATIRRKLAALSSLYEYLCDSNAVPTNPVKGVKRPKVESYEGATPAISDKQASKLLEAPAGENVKTLRDRAILSVMLYHALRRDEVSRLLVEDTHARRGVMYLRLHRKGGKIHNVPLHPDSAEAITAYLEAAGHAQDKQGPLFRPTRNNRTGELRRALTGDSIYKMVGRYAARLNLEIGAHSLRATAATNALENGADIVQVQQWLNHANIATTRIYDHRRSRPQDSPTFKVSY